MVWFLYDEQSLTDFMFRSLKCTNISNKGQQNWRVSLDSSKQPAYWALTLICLHKTCMEVSLCLVFLEHLFQFVCGDGLTWCLDNENSSWFAFVVVIHFPVNNLFIPYFSVHFPYTFFHFGKKWVCCTTAAEHIHSFQLPNLSFLYVPKSLQKNTDSPEVTYWSL